MRLPFLRITCIVLVYLLGEQLVTPCVGQSKDSKVNAPTILVSVHDASALQSIKRMVVFLSGSEPDFANVLQDAISIGLRNMGWHVISRFELEQAVALDFEKWSSTKIDTTNPDAGPDLDDPAIAQLVNADAYLTGTVLIGRKQYMINYEKAKANAATDKLVVTTISFQIVHAIQKKTVLEVVLNYLEGENIPSVARNIRQLIEEQRSR